MGGMGNSIPSGLSLEGGCRGEEIKGWHAVVRQERESGSKMERGGRALPANILI